MGNELSAENFDEMEVDEEYNPDSREGRDSARQRYHHSLDQRFNEEQSLQEEANKSENDDF